MEMLLHSFGSGDLKDRRQAVYAWDQTTAKGMEYMSWWAVQQCCGAASCTILCIAFYA